MAFTSQRRAGILVSPFSRIPAFSYFRHINAYLRFIGSVSASSGEWSLGFCAFADLIAVDFLAPKNAIRLNSEDPFQSTRNRYAPGCLVLDP